MATRESVIARLEAAKAAKATEPRLVATGEGAFASDEAADSLTFAKEPEFVDPVGVTADRPEGRRNWQCSELEVCCSIVSIVHVCQVYFGGRLLCNQTPRLRKLSRCRRLRLLYNLKQLQ